MELLINLDQEIINLLSSKVANENMILKPNKNDLVDFIESLIIREIETI